jgi:adenylosuccinate lyase
VQEELSKTYVPDVDAVDTEEAATRHDVVAFLNVWRRGMTLEAAGWVHRNMTSSDLVDTANALRMVRAEGLILESLYDLRSTLAAKAAAYWSTVRVGRTHGQTAEVTTWGHRLAEFAFAVDRAIERFKMLERWFGQGKLSGPVGDYKRVTREQETEFLLDLSLCQPRLASQIVMRDAYADFVFCLAQVASVVEAIALEVRLSARTDTGEVAEGFAAGQRGSSAMPHKRNPVKAEQLCGLAKLVRAQVDPIMQGVALHHERDISHSSVERVAIELASQITHYMVTSASTLMNDLVVNREAMADRVANSPETGSAFIKDQFIAAGVEPDLAWQIAEATFTEHFNTSGRGLVDSIRMAWARVANGKLPVDPHAVVAELRSMNGSGGRTEHALELMSRWSQRP